MSNSANSIWRSVCSPLWKLRAASMRSNSARGSGSPVSTCAVSRDSTSHSQQKFSMNWLGSSTASHSTPEMPDTANSSTRVSMWCRPWPNSWNSVITSSWVSSAGLSAHRRREVAHQVGHRRLQLPAIGPQPAAAHLVHPGARALAGAGVGVEVELADQFGRGSPCRAARCGRSARWVPDLGAVRADAHARTASRRCGTGLRARAVR